MSLISSIIISSVNNARATARDAQRQTDVNSLRTGMTVFFDNNERYPSDYTELENSSAMVKIPTDITEGVQYPYATSSTDFDVCVAACMEVAENGGGAKGVCNDGSVNYNNYSYINNCPEAKEYYISF